MRKEEEIDEENVKIFRKRDDKVENFFLLIPTIKFLFKASHALLDLFITQRQMILFLHSHQIKWMQLN